MSDVQWMEIISGGQQPCRVSIRIFLRELLFNVFLPFSYIFVKLFLSNADVFLWNRQMVFFGFKKAQALQSHPTFKADSFFHSASIFVADLGRMLWVLGLRSAVLIMLTIVIYTSRLDDQRIDRSQWLAYNYYTEVSLSFVMSLITTLMICLKWSLFPDAFDELLQKQRIPIVKLLNQQIMMQWSPSITQSLWSKPRARLSAHHKSLFFL
jgi:hypothetical protein